MQDSHSFIHYTYIRMNAYMHAVRACINAYIPTYLHMHVRGHTHMQTHIHTYIQIHIHTYSTWMHTYIHTYIHTCTHIHTYIHTYIRYVTIYYQFVSIRFRLYKKVESLKRTIYFICLFNCLWAERRRNDCVETKLSYSLHIQLSALYKRVALGGIHYFCLSQAARDVQQVQDTTNSPLRANGLA